jgi:hypothetical protein
LLLEESSEGSGLFSFLPCGGCQIDIRQRARSFQSPSKTGGEDRNFVRMFHIRDMMVKSMPGQQRIGGVAP